MPDICRDGGLAAAPAAHRSVSSGRTTGQKKKHIDSRVNPDVFLRLKAGIKSIIQSLFQHINCLLECEIQTSRKMLGVIQVGRQKMTHTPFARKIRF